MPIKRQRVPGCVGKKTHLRLIRDTAGLTQTENGTDRKILHGNEKKTGLAILQSDFKTKTRGHLGGSVVGCLQILTDLKGDKAIW